MTPILPYIQGLNLPVPLCCRLRNTDSETCLGFRTTDSETSLGFRNTDSETRIPRHVSDSENTDPKTRIPNCGFRETDKDIRIQYLRSPNSDLRSPWFRDLLSRSPWLTPWLVPWVHSQAMQIVLFLELGYRFRLRSDIPDSGARDGPGHFLHFFPGSGLMMWQHNPKKYYIIFKFIYSVECMYPTTIGTL